MESADDVTVESPDKTTTTLTTTTEDVQEVVEKQVESVTSGTTVTESEGEKQVVPAEEKESVADTSATPKQTDDDEDEKDDIFNNKNVSIFGEPATFDNTSYYETSDSGSEEEEESFEIYDYFGELAVKDQEGEKKQQIDREGILSELQKMQDEKVTIRRKNNFLFRKLTEYYKKRKLDQAFQDSFSDIYEHLYEKYERKIQDLHQDREKWLKDKSIIDDEICNMQLTKSVHTEYLEKILSNLLNREKEVGALLVDPNTGKKIPEKIYERFIQRQRQKSCEIAEIRLVYIKHRDRVKEIENQLKALETIDGTLHLMDFEQLRMENTTYTDKIEERDEELMRLRERHSHANSVLAHTREKSNVIVEEIEEKKEESIRQGYNVSEIREYVNELKIKRDSNRALAEKLNLNSGLLTYPRLLLDMEESLKLEEELNLQIQDLKNTNRIERTKLIAIRNAIEQAEHTIIKHSNNRKKPAKEDKTYYHGRPTIFKPKISGLVHNPKHEF